MSLLTYIKSTCKVNATSQRWINELADNNSTIHFKPGIENLIADTFNRLPFRDIKDLETYSQLCSVDEVKAIFYVAVKQTCNGETWLLKVNIVYVNMENQENEILYEGRKANDFFLLQQISVSLK